MVKTKNDLIIEFKNFLYRNDNHGMEHVGFMDQFGWYCKKHFFHEKCTDDPQSEHAKYFLNSDFYDLMEIFEQNKEFIKFCLDISSEFMQADGKIDKSIPRDEDTEEYKLYHRTLWFLEYFFDPENQWEDFTGTIKLTFRDKWSRLIEEVNLVDWGKISNFVKKDLKYKDFLRTQYWKLIAQKKRLNAKFKCEKCGEKGVLNVHHKTYENLGCEYFHMKDLEVLCECCHRIEHKIDEI